MLIAEAPDPFSTVFGQARGGHYNSLFHSKENIKPEVLVEFTNKTVLAYGKASGANTGFFWLCSGEEGEVEWQESEEETDESPDCSIGVFEELMVEHMRVVPKSDKQFWKAICKSSKNQLHINYDKESGYGGWWAVYAPDGRELGIYYHEYENSDITPTADLLAMMNVLLTKAPPAPKTAAQ